ncbi:BsuPI-related putative proteinase inhibitor [Niallia sp. 03133]|uniref:BsuPI-related putative proteinase inhibitor n=1 Tax=Niallia sp. 03133 TaxID=3458060 RepID=UPI004044F6F3
MKHAFIVCILLFFCPSFVGDAEAQTSNQLVLAIHAAARTDEAEIQLKLSNLDDRPKKLRFSSSQKYEIIIKSETEEEVYRYSLNKAFLQAIQEMTIKPHETYTWKENWNYIYNGSRIEPGEYKIEAVLLPTQLDESTAILKACTTVAVPAENTVYKNIKVKGTNGSYTITGLAKTPNKLLYTVEDGHNELLSNQVVNKQADGSFLIHLEIPKHILPKNGTLILYLIEEAETFIKPFPVELEVFSSSNCIKHSFHLQQ